MTLCQGLRLCLDVGWIRAKVVARVESVWVARVSKARASWRRGRSGRTLIGLWRSLGDVELRGNSGDGRVRGARVSGPGQRGDRRLRGGRSWRRAKWIRRRRRHGVRARVLAHVQAVLRWVLREEG